MTTEQALKLTQMLISSYKNAKIEDDTVKMYSAMIADLDFEACKAAILHLITESEFLPTIAAIRKATLKVNTSIPSGGDAWAEVKRQIRHTGWAGVPTFSTPIIDRAVKAMGGWRYLCETPDDEWSRKSFMQLYDDYCQRDTSERLHTPQAKQLEQSVKEKNLIAEREPARVLTIADYKRIGKEQGYDVEPF